MPRTWLITSSARGLGRTLAEAVLAAGDQLVATARDPDELADLIERYPGRARAVALDVTDPAQAGPAIQAAVDAFGRLDVLAQTETSLWGVINVTRGALPVLLKQGAGHIVQVSSVAGRQKAKWAVEGFAGVLRDEVAPLGIRVTLVEAGDPETGAKAILEVTEVEKRPLRLVLGGDGYAPARVGDQRLMGIASAG
jgi:NAD(P)-dependent dehydrogenase (short-subunit alcohol dehydrogenase family)